MSLTVCQSQPNSSASSATVRPSRPTCSVTHRPARSVNASRGAAIARSWPVHDPTGQPAAGQHQRCLRHTSRARRPNAGRSISSIDVAILDHRLAATARTRRPLTDGLDVHPQRAADVIDDAEHAHRGQANKQFAHAGRFSFQQGLLGSDRRRTPSELPSPCATPRTLYAATPRSFPKRPLTHGSSREHTA